VLTFYLVLFAAGAQDVVSQKTGLTIEPVNLTFRWLILLLPPLAGAFTWKMCRDLAAAHAHGEEEEEEEGDGDGGGDGSTPGGGGAHASSAGGPGGPPGDGRAGDGRTGDGRPPDGAREEARPGVTATAEG
jgi:hypothetical protein